MSHLTAPRRRWFLAFAGIAAACALSVALRRADITDPAWLAKMPVRQLRDREVETLVRAAFRSAERIDIQWKSHDEERNNFYPKVSINDEASKSQLADSFAVGADGKLTDFRPHFLSTMYLQMSFSGPCKPDFMLTGSQEIRIFDKEHGASRSVEVSTAFVRKIADVIGIGYKTVPSAVEPAH